MTSLIAAFKDHPASVGETYFQHMWFALTFAATLFAAGFCALVHSVFPCFFEKTASRMVLRLHDRLVNR